MNAGLLTDELRTVLLGIERLDDLVPSPISWEEAAILARTGELPGWESAAEVLHLRVGVPRRLIPRRALPGGWFLSWEEEAHYLRFVLAERHGEVVLASSLSHLGTLVATVVTPNHEDVAVLWAAHLLSLMALASSWGITMLSVLIRTRHVNFTASLGHVFGSEVVRCFPERDWRAGQGLR